MNPLAKYAATAALGLTTAFTGLHYLSHGFIALEDKALAFLASREGLIVDRLLSRSTPNLETLVDLKARAAGLPPDLVKALIDAESGWKVDAIRFEPHLLRGSTEEARMLASSHGLLQVLGSWARTATCPGVTSWADLYDPAKNITCGVQILSQAKASTGSTRKALLVYNGGPTCATRSCPGAESHANKVLTSFAERQAR